MHRWLPIALMPLLASCLSQSSLDGFPLTERSRHEAVFFVQGHAGDTHRLNEAIAEVLVGRGLNAVVAEPDAYDYRVTYIDRWAWDMRMYLIDLRIDIRDPKTNVLLATARSYQTSLAALGRGRERIIEHTITVLLEGPEASRAPAKVE